MSDTSSVLPADENDSPSLNIVDIQNAVSVIDHAAEQGAFRTWDTIIKVLEVRNRLAKFVEAAPTPADTSVADAPEVPEDTAKAKKSRKAR